MASRAALVLAGLCVVLFGACDTPSARPSPSPSTPEAPDPAPADDAPAPTPSLAGGAPFAFSYLDYNWELGGHQAAVRLEPDGRATAILATAQMEGGVVTPRWHRLTWTATDSEREALRDELREIDFFGLDARYEDPDVEDGAQTTYAVTVGAREHRVHCSNLYPPALQRLTRFVRERFLDPRRASLEAAPPMTRDEAAAIWQAW